MMASVPLDYPDMVSLVDMVRGANDSADLLQALLSSLIKTTTTRGHEADRRRLLGLFADAFSSSNNIIMLRTLFDNCLTDSSFAESNILSSMSTLLLCHECIMIVNDIAASLSQCESDSILRNFLAAHGRETLPTIHGIVENPFDFACCVELLCKQSTNVDAFVAVMNLSSQNASKWREIHQVCRRITVDLKSSFSMSVNLRKGDSNSSDFDAMYIAFLLGSGQHESVSSFN